jgi:hypothetical protein
MMSTNSTRGGAAVGDADVADHQLGGAEIAIRAGARGEAAGRLNGGLSDQNATAARSNGP